MCTTTINKSIRSSMPQLWDACSIRKCITNYAATGAVKKLSGEVLAWISVWSMVQMICIWSSWCHCLPSIFCSSKIHNGLPFWCLSTQVVLEKRPVNTCSRCWLLPFSCAFTRATCHQPLNRNIISWLKPLQTTLHGSCWWCGALSFCHGHLSVVARPTYYGSMCSSFHYLEVVYRWSVISWQIESLLANCEIIH